MACQGSWPALLGPILSPSRPHPRLPSAVCPHPPSRTPSHQTRRKGAKSGSPSPSEVPRLFCPFPKPGSCALSPPPHLLPWWFLSFHRESCVPMNPTSCPVPGRDCGARSRDQESLEKRKQRTEEQEQDHLSAPDLHGFAPHHAPSGSRPLGPGHPSCSPPLSRGCPGDVRGAGSLPPVGPRPCVQGRTQWPVAAPSCPTTLSNQPLCVSPVKHL